MKRIAFVTGITGQDGAYLADLLLKKDYVVHGLQRRSSLPNTARIENYLENKNFHLHYGDMTDSTNLIRLIKEINPTEIYNLAAQSHVAVSFETPEYTANADAVGTLRLLEAIRILGMEKTTKFYQASTSELYGLVQETPQKETTPFYPRSPYAAAKLYAYWITVNYREAYDIFSVNGILFNHESPLRGETFVTRKITKGIANIINGRQKCITLGNLDAKRDWGHAKDFVKGMWLMMQHSTPEDFVLATGETYSVRQFVEKAFSLVNIHIRWQGQGINEEGINSKTGDVLVKIDKKYYRPTEVDLLLGNAEKAQKKLGWKPTVTFEELVKEMMHEDCLECSLQTSLPKTQTSMA